MKIPTIAGLIDRRILINYQVDPEVLAKYLPQPFLPKLVFGTGMAGICLIRLREIRPKGLPKAIGISSENAAHRIAVEWMERGELQSGVFIPRRDTSSRLNALTGGRIFPGTHHLAHFDVVEADGDYRVSFRSKDGTYLSIAARKTDHLNPDSVFADLDCASVFFEKGSVGYSPDSIGSNFDGLELKIRQWKVTPLEVSEVQSSFFADEQIFPKDSIRFDNALLMHHIEHEWKSLGEMTSRQRKV